MPFDERLIYLDHNATTPVDPRVADAVDTALRGAWGNPSSSHPYGRAACEALEQARAEVAELLASSPQEIIFTSGGTEADNLALLGTVLRPDPSAAARPGHLVTTTVEHPAIEEAARELERRGASVTRVGVDPECRVQPAAIAAALREDTRLVSVMHANNESGALNPLTSIAEACRQHGVPLHTDAAQSVGKIPTRVDELGVDLLTIAGHKLYAPKGIGALYVRAGCEPCPTSFGGGQERGLRPGTENVALAVGLGRACALAREELEHRMRHTRELRDRLHSGLRESLGEVLLNGPERERLPNTLNVSLPGVVAREVLARLEGVATSAGSACHEGRDEPSAILTAMGLPRSRALAAVRLSVGATNTADEIDEAIRRIVEAARA